MAREKDIGLLIIIIIIIKLSDYNKNENKF